MMLLIYLLIAEHPAYSMLNLESWFFQTLVWVFNEQHKKDRGKGTWHEDRGKGILTQYKKEHVIDMLTEVWALWMCTDTETVALSGYVPSANTNKNMSYKIYG